MASNRSLSTVSKTRKFKGCIANASACYNDGNFLEAVSILTVALQEYPNALGAFVNRGNAYLQLGKYDEAISDYLAALDININHALAHNNLAILYRLKGQLDAAILHFSEALRIMPRDLVAYINRGLAHAAKKDFDSAIADYTQALQLKGKTNRCAAYYNRANAYFHQGKFAEALLDYLQAANIDNKYSIRDPGDFDEKVVCQNLETILLMFKSGDLDKMKQEDFFSAIDLLPKERQFLLLERCLDESTPLGECFSKSSEVVSKRLRQLLQLKAFDVLPTLRVYKGTMFGNSTPVTLNQLDDCNPVVKAEFYSL